MNISIQNWIYEICRLLFLYEHLCFVAYMIEVSIRVK